MPDDVEPLKGLVGELLAGRVDAIAFTSQIQIRHLFRIAADIALGRELADAMNNRSMVASVGPVCTATLEGFGVTPLVTPDHPRMGAMIVALAEFIESRPW